MRSILISLISVLSLSAWAGEWQNKPILCLEKQEILEELNIEKRAEKAISLIAREIQRIKLGDEIQSEVHDEITKTQREY